MAYGDGQLPIDPNYPPPGVIPGFATPPRTRWMPTTPFPGANAPWYGGAQFQMRAAPALPALPQQTIQSVPAPVPQGGGMFAPAPVPAQSAGMFGSGTMAGPFTGMSGAVPPPPATAQLGLWDRVSDAFRNNQAMLWGISSGLLDKSKNDNVSWGEIFQRGAVGHEYDRDRKKEDREERRSSVTANLFKQKFGYDEATADAVASSPELMNYHLKLMSGADATEDQEELRQINQERTAAGLPTYRLDEWITNRSASGATRIDMAGQKAWNTETAKLFAQDYIDMQKGSRAASAMIGRIDQLEGLLANPNVYQGAGGEHIADLRRWANALGIRNADGLGEADAARAITNEMALQLRNPAGGAGMPGAMSDQDRAFLQQMPPGLSKTPGGNALLVDYWKRMKQREIDVARLANEYIRQSPTGELDVGFYDYLAEWSEQNPLFPEAAEGGTPADSGAGDYDDLYREFGIEPVRPRQ